MLALIRRRCADLTSVELVAGVMAALDLLDGSLMPRW
jgi:hypothetical protein